MIFDTKSILKIVGTYQINDINGDISSHDISQDILSIVYDEYFHQATIDNINPILPSSNNFTIFTEVDNFQTVSIILILRTKINGNEVVLTSRNAIQPPDDFLSGVIYEDIIFEYDSNNFNDADDGGCTQPYYPEYDCSALYDNGSCGTTGLIEQGSCSVATYSGQEVCTCENERCLGLCGTCLNENGDSIGGIQQDCPGNWVEYCGTEQQWQCGTSDFGFYNESEFIATNFADCKVVPQKPTIQFYPFNEIGGETLKISEINFPYQESWIHEGGLDIPFVGNTWYPPLCQTDLAPIDGSNPKHIWADRPDLVVEIQSNYEQLPEKNSFNVVSFDLNKVVCNDQTTPTFVPITNMNGAPDISLINIGSITRVSITFDYVVQGSFKIRIPYDDIVTWRLSLKNINFQYISENDISDTEFNYDKNHSIIDIQVVGSSYEFIMPGGVVDQSCNTVYASGPPSSNIALTPNTWRQKTLINLYEPGKFRYTSIDTDADETTIQTPDLKNYMFCNLENNEDYAYEQIEEENEGGQVRRRGCPPFGPEGAPPEGSDCADLGGTCQFKWTFDGDIAINNVQYQYNATSRIYTQKIKLHRGANQISFYANRKKTFGKVFGGLAANLDEQYYFLCEIIPASITPWIDKITIGDSVGLEGTILRKVDNEVSPPVENYPLAADCGNWNYDGDTITEQFNYYKIFRGGAGGGGNLDITNFGQIQTGPGSIYTLFVCSENVNPEDKPYCYDEEGNLLNVFEFEYSGYLSTGPGNYEYVTEEELERGWFSENKFGDYVGFSVPKFDDKSTVTIDGVQDPLNSEYLQLAGRSSDETGNIDLESFPDDTYNLLTGPVSGQTEFESPYHFDPYDYPHSRNLQIPMIIPGTQSFYPGLFKSLVYDEENRTLVSGIQSQCKEMLYDDVNTILSLDENVLTIQALHDDEFNNPSAFGHSQIISENFGIQGRFADIIQYETELISHADLDFDCEYDPETGIVSNGYCYDTWLGTLTGLKVGAGYSWKLNEYPGPTHADYVNTFVDAYSGLDNLNVNLNVGYDYCGICSGGFTLHEPNSDMDESGVCVEDLREKICYISRQPCDDLEIGEMCRDYILGGNEAPYPYAPGGPANICIENPVPKFCISTHIPTAIGGGTTPLTTLPCMSDGDRDDICLGTCCLEPNEIVDWYEADNIGDNVGKTYNNKKRLCDNSGEVNEAGFDVYKVKRCPDDLKEYPMNITGPDNIITDDMCNPRCDTECVEVHYFKEANDCPGELDCFDICHDEINNEFAVFDIYGVCCKRGNIDVSGKCFGSASTADCEYEFQTNFEPTQIYGPSSDIFSDPIAIGQSTDNSGAFNLYIKATENIRDIYLPIYGVEIQGVMMELNPQNEDFYISFVNNDIYISPTNVSGEILKDTEITIVIEYSNITEQHLCIGGGIKIDTSFDVTIAGGSPAYFNIDFAELGETGGEFYLVEGIGEGALQCFRSIGVATPFDDWKYYGCNENDAPNYDTNCDNWDSIDCSSTFCQYEGDRFLELLNLYLITGASAIEGVDTPIDLDAWLQQYSDSDLVTHLQNLLRKDGDNLNQSWAATHYDLLFKYLDDDTAPYYGLHQESWQAGYEAAPTPGSDNEAVYAEGVAFGMLCENNTCDDQGYEAAETAIFTNVPQIYNTTYFPNGDTNFFIYEYDEQYNNDGSPLYPSLHAIYQQGYNDGLALIGSDNVEYFEEQLQLATTGYPYQYKLTLSDGPNQGDGETDYDYIIFEYNGPNYQYLNINDMIDDTTGGIYGAAGDGYDDESFDMGYTAGVGSVTAIVDVDPMDGYDDSSYSAGYAAGEAAGGGSAANPEIPITANVWNFVGYGFAESVLILPHALASFNNYLTSGDMIQGPSNEDGTISTITYNGVTEPPTWDGAENFYLQPGRGYRVWYQNSGIFQWSTQVPDLPDLPINDVCSIETAYNYYTQCGEITEEDNLFCPSEQNWECCIGPEIYTADQQPVFSYNYFDSRYCGNDTALNYNPNLTDCQNNPNHCINNNSSVLTFSGDFYFINDTKFMLDFIIVNNLLDVDLNYIYTDESNWNDLYNATSQYFNWDSGKIKSINIIGFPNLQLPYSIGVLNGLQSITMKNCDLDFIPSSFQNAISNSNNLNYLDLSYNNLDNDSLTDGSRQILLSKFVTVDISNNDFTSLEPMIVNSSSSVVNNIETLNVSNNTLEEIPSSIENLGKDAQYGTYTVNMRNSLPDNYTLPDEFLQLSDVFHDTYATINCSSSEWAEVHVGGSAFSDDGATMYCYKGIQYLDLSENLNLQWDEDTILETAIYRFSIANNNYTSLPTKLPWTAVVLDFSHNDIQNITSAILDDRPNNNWQTPASPPNYWNDPYAYSIQQLDLSNNNLQDISEFIFTQNQTTPKPHQLEKFSVAYNTALTNEGNLNQNILNYQATWYNGGDSFPMAGLIFHLDLRGIGLERFPEEQPYFFTYIPINAILEIIDDEHYIDIADNPFYCDCQPSDETYYEDINNCIMPEWVKDGLIGINRDGLFPLYSTVSLDDFRVTLDSQYIIEGEFIPTPWIIGFDNRDCSVSPGSEE